MKVYIAGAITNNPRYKEQFETAEKRLISMNHAVINPVKNLGFEYREYIDMGLCELMKCDAIYLLDGYEKSKGAQLELLYAQTVGMKIIEENPCLYWGSETQGGTVVSELIEIISQKDKLLDFMERYNLTGLRYAAEEQLREYIKEVLR